MMDDNHAPNEGVPEIERIEFAPDHTIIEWEPEIERWLPVAVGYSVYDALVTDESDLTDFMEYAPSGKYDEHGREYHHPKREDWSRARDVLLDYGVDIGEHGDSLDSDTNLVSLAKRTAGHNT